MIRDCDRSPREGLASYIDHLQSVNSPLSLLRCFYPLPMSYCNALSCDDSLIYSGGSDGIIRVFDINSASLSCLAEVGRDAHLTCVHSLIFLHDDNKQLLAVDMHGTVVLFNVLSKTEIVVIRRVVDPGFTCLKRMTIASIITLINRLK